MYFLSRLISDLRRAVTSSASSVRSLTRTQSSKSYTSATSGSKTTTGERSATKPLHKALSGEIKVIPKSPGSSPGSSPRTSNLKGLGSVAVNHRRSSSLDMNFKSDIPATLETSGLSGGSRHNGSPHSQGNSATSKRKQWVWRTTMPVTNWQCGLWKLPSVQLLRLRWHWTHQLRSCKKNHVHILNAHRRIISNSPHSCFFLGRAFVGEGAASFLEASKEKHYAIRNHSFT